MAAGPVAILDIGSNSIKLLVAARGADGRVVTLHGRSLDARISAGISRENPRLGEAGLARGLDAIRTLLADADAWAAGTRILVATSAVRDARNGAEFQDRVRALAGVAPRILSGDEEARLIGRGLGCDPALQDVRDFFLFDLGGGSLECLEFAGRAVRQMASVPLGCVRLTERFVPEPEDPLPAAVPARIAEHVRTVVAGAGFTLPRSAPALAVATGGTVATVRAIEAARTGVAFAAVPAAIPVARFRAQLAWLGGLPLAARRAIPGLPPARADVFPAALATLVAVADLGGFTSFTHSLYNLRYGLAAEALDAR